MPDSRPPTPPSAAPSPATKEPDFLTTRFGNPESDEIRGTDNDYETEPEQIKDEKRTAGQAIWYLGLALVVIVVAIVLQGP
jgi:hypothetical protein